MTIGQNAVGAAFDQVDTSPLFDLGTVMWSGDGKAYVYGQANGAVTGDGYVVSFNEAWDATMIDTDTAATTAEGNLVGVAEAVFTDNQYGWFQIFGPCGIRSEQDALANSKLGPTADAGQVDDAGSVGSAYIRGMHFGTATGGADAVNATGFLNWPQMAIVGTYA